MFYLLLSLKKALAPKRMQGHNNLKTKVNKMLTKASASVGPHHLSNAS